MSERNLAVVGEEPPTHVQAQGIDSGRPAPTNKYTCQLDIPAQFPMVLKDLTREILREQPENIYQFAALYFAQKIAEVEGTKQDAME